MAIPAGNLLECPICFETFEDPQLLGDCGHTFCRRCVEMLNPRRCPTCRRPFRPNAVLPNFALAHLISEQRGGPGVSPGVGEQGQADHGAGAPEGGAGGASGGQAGQQGGSWLSSVISRGAGGADLGVQSVMDLGVPAGLAKLVNEERQQIAQRIFLLDNSGSTSYPDGQILDVRPSGDVCFRRCTRWEEITHTAMDHARWNLQTKTPCEFVLLNPLSPGRQLEEGIDFQRIDPSRGDGEKQLAALQKLLTSIGPRGATPLTERLREIYQRISPEARNLARNGQRVIIVIATDGLPTGNYGGADERKQQELVQMLRKLSANLPVHLVVRLCTDSDDVVDFYNSIDEEVELQLEVIDDIRGEAREARRAGNGWLTYSPLIHRMREGGTFMKLFDLLDERPLNAMEVSMFCQLLLRKEVDDEPLSSEPYEFCRQVQAQIPNMPLVFDPLRNSMAPPVALPGVQWAVLPKSKVHRFCGNVLTCTPM